MGAMGLSSQDEADRLQRRVRVLSDRLEETEDRLDAALEQIRELRVELKGSGGKKKS
jgi:predicted  nucleic acid-binding Zn-ribbon protein